MYGEGIIVEKQGKRKKGEYIEKFDSFKGKPNVKCSHCGNIEPFNNNPACSKCKRKFKYT